ncbi:MAG: hypothetical protein NTY65_02145 [Planctomycetota bacterium]|nr:hypothetical protein [Planctomycetota bacterium]
MKRLLWLSLAAAAALTVGCQKSAQSTPEGQGGAAKAPLAREVDNSRCHVCHLNFSDEQLAVNHAKNGVGCEKCHGASDDHASDEANITPPQIMYPREKIDAACKVCHPDPMERIVAGAKYCLHVLVTAEEQKKVCADCHGAHRMAHRSVRWDKVTGKVLPKANGQG